MAALYPLTLAYWNNIILSGINALAQNPPEGCDPLDELELVTAPHKWTVQDITVAQDKLTEICSDNIFTAAFPGSKWRKLHLDELEEAIDNGWCNCEPPIPCCIPYGDGTVWINGPGGGYWVTIPYWQVIEQYLYGNISYGAAEEALPDGVMAHLVECYAAGSDGSWISHSFHHGHWVNCVYQDYWLEGGKRGEEHWNTCQIDPDEITYLGRVPALASSYQSSTVVGPTNYYGQPWYCSAWHYDYIEHRWYQECWIGSFEVDAYWYYFDFALFRCPA